MSFYEFSVKHGVGSSAGVFVFLKKALPHTNLSIESDTNERFISCDFSIFFSREWGVLCVYAHNVASEREFLRELSPYLKTDSTVVLLGDFNCVSKEQ